MSQLVVDGMNVIGSRPDGWWKDREGAVRKLHTRLTRLAAATEAKGGVVSLVLDGRALEDLPEGDHDGVAVIYAHRRGRDAADDRIIELVATFADPTPEGDDVTVVTSDRDLAARARKKGAKVIGAGELLRRLDRHDPPEES
jgi:predicted RNA-binding protein with PIN domain